MHNLEELRYPIGRFVMPKTFAGKDFRAATDVIRNAPSYLRSATSNLSKEQLDTPYRPNGWTVRQVVHHFADSHINAYVRLKWALTEQQPTIKTYDEVEWANLSDGLSGEIEVSLKMVEALHARWALVLKILTETQRARTITHPEWGAVTVDYLAAMYAWHSTHHIAHITSLASRLGWTE